MNYTRVCCFNSPVMTCCVLPREAVRGSVTAPRRSALMAGKQRAEVLKDANELVVPHVPVGFAIEVVCGGPHHFIRYSGAPGGLKERQIVQLVILVIDDNETFDIGMPPQPIGDRIASGLLWQIRCRIDERDAVMPGAEHARRVIA